MAEQRQTDFEQALGEEFSDAVSPPVPFEDASAHECCEVVWAVAGRDVTPAGLAALGGSQVAALAHQFGEYFGCEPPTAAQVERAIARTLARWPAGGAEPGAAADRSGRAGSS